MKRTVTEGAVVETRPLFYFQERRENTIDRDAKRPYDEIVIRLLELKGPVVGPVQPEPILPDHPEWLRSFDPTAGDGLGHADSTYNPYEALRFPTIKEAIAFYRTETSHGRPLTTFTVEFTSLKMAVHEYVNAGVRRLARPINPRGGLE